MRSPRTATKSSPRSPQLEKARVQQQRPNAAKNKNKLKKNKKHSNVAMLITCSKAFHGSHCPWPKALAPLWDPVSASYLNSLYLCPFNWRRDIQVVPPSNLQESIMLYETGYTIGPAASLTCLLFPRGTLLICPSFNVSGMVLPQGFFLALAVPSPWTALPQESAGSLPHLLQAFAQKWFSVIPLTHTLLETTTPPSIPPHTLKISSYVLFAPSHLSPPIVLSVYCLSFFPIRL